jgi:hypothetical protein
MKPVQHMMCWTRAGGFAKQSRTVGSITQDGDRCSWRRSQSMKHTAQPASGPIPTLGSQALGEAAHQIKG